MGKTTRTINMTCKNAKYVQRGGVFPLEKQRAKKLHVARAFYRQFLSFYWKASCEDIGIFCFAFQWIRLRLKQRNCMHFCRRRPRRRDVEGAVSSEARGARRLLRDGLWTSQGCSPATWHRVASTEPHVKPPCVGFTGLQPLCSAIKHFHNWWAFCSVNIWTFYFSSNEASWAFWVLT